MNLLQFLHMLFESLDDPDSINFMHLDALLWNCPGLMAQWGCGVFIIELSGCGLSITESLCVSQVERPALPSLLFHLKHERYARASLVA